MRQLITLLLTVSALISSAVLIQELRAQQPAPKNLVQDNSLEGPLGDDGLPKGWQGAASEPDEGYHVRVVDGGRTGGKSLLIEGKGDWGVVSTNLVKIDPKMRYRARGWVKIEGGAQAAADVKFHYFDEEQEYLGQTRIPFVSPPTKDWAMIEVTDRVADFPKAKWIQVAVAMVGKGKSWYDDLELTAHRREGLASDFDLSPQLRIVNRLTGDWKIDSVYKSARWTPGGLKKTETITCKWILENNFLEGSGREIKPGEGEHRTVTGYDARRKAYRVSYFDSRGNSLTASGTWDDKTSTLTWQFDSPTGEQTKARHRFIDADTYEYRFISKSTDGELLMDVQSTHRRIKK